jgi:hypothetical protein
LHLEGVPPKVTGRMLRVLALLLLCAHVAQGQLPPYDVRPHVAPPYYRIRHEATGASDTFAFAATFTVWIPPGCAQLRGVIVHQHGCGEGSCKSGLTGAHDLHWQALARKHQCALLAPVYGSDLVFQRALSELGTVSGHPELATVPWALWGHSGGGHWAGGMVFLHPDRIVGAWLRSGVPPTQNAAGRPAPYAISDAACQVPILCNLGVKEGVSDRTNRFAGVWPGVEQYFTTMRSRGALIGVSIDPLTSHECGNQRYLAIPWLDACLTARLPKRIGAPLKPMPAASAYLAPVNANGTAVIPPVPASKYPGKRTEAIWLPNQEIAIAWEEYSRNTAVSDRTPPPAPRNVHLQGNHLTWESEADVESGLAQFLVERDGQVVGRVPETPKNPFGRPVFQNLQYSDTPPQPLAVMQFTDTTADPARAHHYRVIAVNTVGLTRRSAVAVGR